MVTLHLPKQGQQKYLITFLFIFSVSLALSKSAVTVLMTLIYLSTIYFIIRYKDYRRTIAANMYQPLTLPLLLYLAVAIGGLFYTEAISDGLGIANKIATLFLVYFMTSVLIDAYPDEKERVIVSNGLILMFIAGMLILDVIGLLTYFGIFGQRKFTLPVYPMHVHHIWFANMNAVGIYAALSFILFRSSRQEPRKRTLLIIFIVLALVCILLSISRTSWFGMIATGIVLAYLYTDKKRMFSFTMAVGVSSCLLAYYFIPFIHDRINIIYTDIIVYSATGGDTYSSLGDRFLMWKSATKMFLTNPLFGIGTGDYVVTIKSYVSAGLLPTRMLDYNQPHNMYLFSLATNGIIGLSAMVFIFYRIFAFIRSSRDISPEQKQLFFLATAVAVHYLVAGMTDSLFNIFILRFTFAFVMGICIRTGTSPVPKT